ncbi:4a-hydroxytetrahydrobiopterin dehydratase [Rubrivirga marina]|uniref:Putative pterin-4-alpha-carbinolamine dehydratase n=1 Tax=Rubrivirga marina TaxID=1196024 RepID=A0A271J4M5_9BACT|nr:4a-hydroxytetrahydrobiopterin dehydratase [Rubrivirga marina]PAP77639.1 4a-hydroxytetrahydrobiopterin dehydratase [Rubrivirga marina]
MPARDPLSDDQIAAALADLDGWRAEADDDGTWIARDFAFADFQEAFAFLVRVAFVAEDMDHHPEISNVYDRVSLGLSTHDAGNRVTETDLAFAARVDALPGADAA